MNILIKELENLKKFKEYVSDINKKISPIVLSGLSSVGKIQLLEATKEFADRNICIVTYNELQAKKIYKDLKYFSGNVVYFPKREIASYDYVAESKDLPYERIETLNKIFEQEKSAKKNENRLIVITTIEAMMQKMISKESRYYQKIMEMYLDKDEVVVLDANVGGVQLRYFKQMANLKDESYLKSMVCYRFVKEKEFINQFIENALSYLHTPYDYEMDSTNDQKLYCSELVVWSLKKMNIEFSQNTKLFQYTIISPTDLITDLKRQKMIKKVLILEQ